MSFSTLRRSAGRRCGLQDSDMRVCPKHLPFAGQHTSYADVCDTTALQRFDDAAAAKYPSAARYFGMLYSNPTFAAIAPAHRAAKAFSYHESGQPWGDGPHPLSPEMQASYGPLPWSGEGCTCLQCLGPVLSLCPLSEAHCCCLDCCSESNLTISTLMKTGHVTKP